MQTYRLGLCAALELERKRTGRCELNLQSNPNMPIIKMNSCLRKWIGLTRVEELSLAMLKIQETGKGNSQACFICNYFCLDFGGVALI